MRDYIKARAYIDTLIDINSIRSLNNDAFSHFEKGKLAALVISEMENRNEYVYETALADDLTSIIFEHYNGGQLFDSCARLHLLLFKSADYMFDYSKKIIERLFDEQYENYKLSQNLPQDEI